MDLGKCGGTGIYKENVCTWYGWPKSEEAELRKQLGDDNFLATVVSGPTNRKNSRRKRSGLRER